MKPLLAGEKGEKEENVRVNELHVDGHDKLRGLVDALLHLEQLLAGPGDHLGVLQLKHKGPAHAQHAHVKILTPSRSEASD